MGITVLDFDCGIEMASETATGDYGTMAENYCEQLALKKRECAELRMQIGNLEINSKNLRRWKDQAEANASVLAGVSSDRLEALITLDRRLFAAVQARDHFNKECDALAQKNQAHVAENKLLLAANKKLVEKLAAPTECAARVGDFAAEVAACVLEALIDHENERTRGDTSWRA
jgi:hypothetical protein